MFRFGLILWCSLLFAQSTFCQSYTFTTLAGRGSLGSADGPGAAARFARPGGVAVDSAGNIYVADILNHAIRKITPDGVVSTLAGMVGISGSADGVGTNAQFYSPTGIAVDSAGTVYVADMNNYTIRKITPEGAVSTLAGLAGSRGSSDGPGSSARFYRPSAVAVDSTKNVYVADTYNHTIRKITPAGVVSTLAGLAGAYGSLDGYGSGARFNTPSGIAVDSAKNVYVADTYNYTVRKITPSGSVSTFAGKAGGYGTADGTGSSAQFGGLCGVTVDSAGNLFVADSNNHTIRKITAGGSVSTLAGLAGVAGGVDGAVNGARFSSPLSLAADSAGNLYVADTANHTIRKITAGATVSTLAGLPGSIGNTDGMGSDARFNQPNGVAVGASGTLFVADTFNYTIRKITSGAVVSTLAGLGGTSGSADGVGSDARFNKPYGVAADEAGNVYVADTFNHTIRKISADGVVSTLAGLAGISGSADGPGPDARFNKPYGVAADGAGNVYVADTYNCAIRKISPEGMVSTVAGLAGAFGSTDGTAGNARFFWPDGVAVDGAGNLYVADTANYTIRKVSVDGVVSTVAGLAKTAGTTDGVGSAARFLSPTGIGVDSAGTVYVADSSAFTIRTISLDGTVTTIAGSAVKMGNTDGPGANARFASPFGFAADTRGNIYVADSGNNTIRFGRLATTTPPALSFCLTGGQFLLSWPQSANNYVVETSSSLIPGAVWTPLPGPASTAGDSFVLTNAVESGARFYRLRTP